MQKLILFFCVIVLVSCSEGAAEKNGQANGSASEVIEVTGVVASSALSRNFIQTTGTVLADEEVNIVSEISGRIIQIAFKEGANVTKGQLLVKINDDELKAQLGRLEYERKLAADIEGRQQQLLDIKAISQEEYDRSLNGRNVLDAQINLLKAQLDKTEIRAPFPGVVGLRYFSPGAALSPGVVITSLQSISPVKLEFSIPERHISAIKTGDEVLFSVQGRKDTLHAKIYAREPGIDAANRTLRFRASYPNTKGELTPGAFANVQVPLSEEIQTITIPTNAVVPVLNGAKVWIQKNGVVAEKAVVTGQRNAQDIEILEGLAAGDTVITSGLMRLKLNMPVNVKLADANTNTANTP
jgi:membrane fusion protein (multidrug efflux system)